MRIVQIVFFALGVIAFLAAAWFHDSMNGQTFWRVGVAFMITDVVMIMLWPNKKLGTNADG